ncbi:hypothetical protein STEG23_020742 [Scotinomys teguina]
MESIKEKENPFLSNDDYVYKQLRSLCSRPPLAGTSFSEAPGTWKELSSGLWKGPDPVLVWARGAVCVFPQDGEIPIWVPECCVRTVDASRSRPDVDPCGEFTIVAV